MQKADRTVENRWLPGIVWIVSGTALGAAAVLCLAASSDRLTEIASWIGASMLISGGVNIWLYFYCLKGSSEGKWLLADGLTATLLSVFPLFNEMILPAVIPFFFCVWDLFSGVLRVMESTEKRKVGITGWKGSFFIGLIEMIAGVVALLKPVEEALTMHIVVGLILLIQAVAFIFLAVMELKNHKIDKKEIKEEIKKEA